MSHDIALADTNAVITPLALDVVLDTVPIKLPKALAQHIGGLLPRDVDITSRRTVQTTEFIQATLQRQQLRLNLIEDINILHSIAVLFPEQNSEQ
jgi:hypothetical protein